MNIKIAFLTASILATSMPVLAGPLAEANLGTVNDVTVGSFSFPVGTTNASTYSFNTGTVSTSTSLLPPIANSTASGVGFSDFVATTNASGVGLGTTIVGSNLEALNATGLDLGVRATGLGTLSMEALALNQVIGETGAVGGSFMGGPTVSVASSRLEAYGVTALDSTVSRTCLGSMCVNNYSGTAVSMNNATGHAGVVSVGVAPFSNASVFVNTVSSSGVAVD